MKDDDGEKADGIAWSHIWGTDAGLHFGSSVAGSDFMIFCHIDGETVARVRSFVSALIHNAIIDVRAEREWMKVSTPAPTDDDTIHELSAERLVQAIHFTLLDLYDLPRTTDMQWTIDRLETAIGYRPTDGQPRCRYCGARVANEGEVHAGGCGRVG